MHFFDSWNQLLGTQRAETFEIQGALSSSGLASCDNAVAEGGVCEEDERAPPGPWRLGAEGGEQANNRTEAEEPCEQRIEPSGKTGAVFHGDGFPPT